MTIDTSNTPASLRKMADDLERGILKETSCIVESDDYASYFFGEDLLYTEAMDVVGSLLGELEKEVEVGTAVTIN